jgi:hypothetical protein
MSLLTVLFLQIIKFEPARREEQRLGHRAPSPQALAADFRGWGSGVCVCVCVCVCVAMSLIQQFPP